MTDACYIKEGYHCNVSAGHFFDEIRITACSLIDYEQIYTNGAGALSIHFTNEILLRFYIPFQRQCA